VAGRGRMLLATSPYVAKSQPEKRRRAKKIKAAKKRSTREVLSDATNCGVGGGS